MNEPYTQPPDVLDIGDIKATDRDKEMFRYAILSSTAYDMYNLGYDKAQKNMQEFLPAHNLDKELSDINSIVAVKEYNNSKNEAVISYRGTVPWNVRDWVPDIQIAAGLPLSRNFGLMGRFAEAQDKFDAVKLKYPAHEIITTGHSLGGSQAALMGKRNNVKSYLFNAGSSPGDAVFDWSKSTDNNVSTHFYVPGDVVGGSKALTNSKDKLIPINPNKWWNDLLSVGVATAVNPIFGAGVAATSLFADIHGMANFLPIKDMFKEELEPDDMLYKWVSPMYQQAKAMEAPSKRGKTTNFDRPPTINREDFKRCLNPYNPKCQLKL